MPTAEPTLPVTAEDDQVSLRALGIFNNLCGWGAFEQVGLDREIQRVQQTRSHFIQVRLRLPFLHLPIERVDMALQRAPTVFQHAQ